MIKEQFERLKKMHGFLFPVLNTDGTSFVSTTDFVKEAIEENIGRPVQSTTLLAFLIGNDIEDMPLLPLVVFVAVAKVNGNMLGLSDEEIYTKIKQNYSACEWITHERADKAVEELARVKPDEIFSWERYSNAIADLALSFRTWIINENGDVVAQAMSLKELYETLAKDYDFAPGAQFLPQCDCMAN